MKFSMPDLLRRTIFAAGAIAAFALAAAPSQAQQTVNLVEQSTLGTCVFSGALTVLPNGALQVTCTAGTSDRLGLRRARARDAGRHQRTSLPALVTRSGGTGTATVNYSVTGVGCVPRGHAHVRRFHAAEHQHHRDQHHGGYLHGEHHAPRPAIRRHPPRRPSRWRAARNRRRRRLGGGMSDCRRWATVPQQTSRSAK